jgi:hypothetical protein
VPWPSTPLRTRAAIVDVDSSIGQAYGKQKEGVGFGYTKQRGYHPLLASRAGTAEVLHVRLRNGQANTQTRRKRAGVTMLRSAQ